MSGARKHLTLAQKGLILVAVPLAFELVLLGFLCWLLHLTEVETRQADLSKSVISKTNEVMEACHDVGIAFIVYDAATKPYFHDIYVGKVEELHQSLADLAIAVQDNQEHLTIVDNCATEAEESLKVLEKRKHEIESGGRLDLVEALDLENELKTIVKKLEVIITDERAAQEARAIQRSDVLLKVILGVIILSVIVAFLAVVIFQRGTDKRLKVLIDNSHRLGAGQPLAPVLEGADEIAQIDKVFHEAANRLNEAAQLKQQFVAMISHDLRTPLSAVKSTLELLGDETWGALSEKAKNKIDRAEGNLKHAIDLINNLLDLEKMQSGSIELKVEPIALGTLLENCGNVVAPLAERSSMVLSLPKSCEIQLLADEQKLTQVVINLLGNAIKFSPAGSIIKVAATQEQNNITVTIQDQGPGIPDDVSEKIFDRYHQLATTDGVKHEGSGLGLAICKAIVEAHGGSIGVKKAPERGSIFWFQIPEGGSL